MSHFIKAGSWIEKRKGLKGELDLDWLISTVVPSPSGGGDPSILVESGSSEKISAMAAATDLTGAVFTVVQGGVNKKASESLVWKTAGTTTLTSTVSIEAGVNDIQFTSAKLTIIDKLEIGDQTDYVISIDKNTGITISADFVNVLAGPHLAMDFIGGSGSGVSIDYYNTGSNVNTFRASENGLDIQTTSDALKVSIANDAGTTGEYLGSDGAGNVVWGTPSDISLKENITDLPSSTELIQQLRPVEFDMKESGEHTVGFIAQEVEQVFPDMVSIKNNGLKHLKTYTYLEPYLVKCIQELTERIKILENGNN
jgi:hypothetical protein